MASAKAKKLQEKSKKETGRQKHKTPAVTASSSRKRPAATTKEPVWTFKTPGENSDDDCRWKSREQVADEARRAVFAAKREKQGHS